MGQVKSVDMCRNSARIRLSLLLVLNLRFCTSFFVLTLYLLNNIDLSSCVSPINTFVDVTKELGLSSVKGILAGFGDVDSDRDTDIFFISEKGKRLDIYNWQTSTLKFQRFSTAVLSIPSDADDVITNVAPLDYDGDGCMDLLVTLEGSNQNGLVQVYIYWSNKGKFESRSDLGRVANFTDHPLVLDVNGDLLPDLLGTDYSTRERIYLISGDGKNKRTYKREPQKNSQNIIKDPQSSAFVDMNGDYHADLFIPALSNQTNEGFVFEIWKSEDGQLSYDDVNGKIDFIKNEVGHMGQVSFGDFDMDGNLDFIVPVCLDENCENSMIYLYSLGKWYEMMSGIGMQQWRLPKDDFKKSSAYKYFPPTFRVGDFNMDGYPDVVAVLEIYNPRTGYVQKRAFLLENVPCSSHHCNSSRTFRLHKDIEALNAARDPLVIAFVDLYENGVLDLLVVQGDHTIKAFKNDFNTDTSFLKVAVLSGRCYKECTCFTGKTPYGANQVGAVVKYVTTAPNGGKQTCVAAQLIQSAHFSLQLPYTVFGLGRTPNFVDQMIVGIPQGKEKVDRMHKFPSLIPNSQVIVIPYPPNKPSDWMIKLLVTPSKLLLETGGVLIGTCLLVAGLILILHIKEKKEDEREKRQEAHKFHFDAL